jgi:hypothetical protein
MFGFRKKKRAPTLCPANPGIGVEARVAFSNANRSWTEEVNLVDLATAVFKEQGYSVTHEKTWVFHGDSDFRILPQLVEFQPLDDGGVRTVTTMQINHPRLLSAGIFEYQHSTGNSIADSISKGYDQWVQTDFVPLLDALRSQPESCTAMVMEFPPRDGKPSRIRRAILGPVTHFMQTPPSDPQESTPDEHPFCPCCLLTKSFEAFRGLIEQDGFHGLRLFAARDPEGDAQADCRVNGEDWERGAQALREYATTWPPAGYEFRKQYVVLQSIERNAVPGAATDGGCELGTA